MLNKNQKIKLEIPETVLNVAKTLKDKGFLAFLAGGCVRDSLIGRAPKDWDIATDAKPEQIIELFEKTVYENRFGTVTIVDEQAADETLRDIEITPFRLEGKYSNKRILNYVSKTRRVSSVI